MPGRPRGRAAPADRHEPADAYPGYPGYGAHPDDEPGYDDHYDDGPPPARNGRAGPPARNPGPARNGSAGPPAAGRAPLRPVPADDDEPVYARDHTPLGYDGGDPDDPESTGLLTHGGQGDDGRRNGRPATGRNGFDRAGFDREGFDRDGFDREGFDRDGFDRDGYDRDGYLADDVDDGYDDAGYDDRYVDDEYDDYDDELEDDEEYDDDAYGVGDGPLAVPPPGSNGRPLGPADVEELDPSMTDALARIDLGSMQVPVPFGADLTLEPAEAGRPQAVHLMLPEGRIAVSALAAPRSSGLWAELADEIETSLRGGGARVRSTQGDWGRELHARTENAASVFIGADGPRWMVYGVATAAMETVEALDVELRRVMRGIIVVRGKLPYPPRTVLPIERVEDRDEAENADKPRAASITVSVPAARTTGATPSGAPASNGRPDATTRTPAAGAATTRTPAADGTTTRTPAASGRAAADGAARNGVPRNGAARNGAVPPGPARRPAPPAAAPPPPAAAEGPAPGRPAPRRGDAPDRGPAPAGRPAANAPGRPAPEEPLDGPTRRTAAAGPGRDAGRGARPGDAPRGAPHDTGSARAPLAAEETGVLRPRAATEATGAGRVRPDSDQTGALPARRAPAPEDTGAGRARRDVEDTGARRGRNEDTGARARRDAEGTGAGRARRGEDTGAGRARAEDTGGRRALRDPEAAGLPPRAPAGSREPVSREPVSREPVSREPEPRDREAPATRMLPPAEAPAAGPVSARRGELLWSASPADDDRVPAGADRFDPADPAGPIDPVDEAPPARRDPAVTSLPSFGSDRDPGRTTWRPEPVDESAWTPPSGTNLTGTARRRGDDDVTPRGGSRAADPFAGLDRWGSDPDPAPVSRMAIEDIPLSDVPLEEATLDNEPVAQAELPRRRPGGTRRRDVPATDGRGTRRRGPEEDVLSDWMSAEIAARPSGRHAGAGHRDRSAENGSSARDLTDRRGTDRWASGDDLFRAAGDGRDDEPVEERRERPRRGRDRAGTDGGGSRRASADDPMTLFSAARDPGRHRR